MLGLISGPASHTGNEAAAVGAEDVGGNERCKPLRAPSNAGKHDGLASTLGAWTLQNAVPDLAFRKTWA